MSKSVREARMQARAKFKSANPVFFEQGQQADTKVLSQHLIKQARRSGQLILCGRGLATGKCLKDPC